MIGIGLSLTIRGAPAAPLVSLSALDALPGTATFVGPANRSYFDVNGVLQTVGVNVPRMGTKAHYIGGLPTLLLEGAATNILAAGTERDLSNAAWTKTTMTAAKDQTGIDGVINSASSLVATAGNATALQAIVLASSTRNQSAYVKRLVGAGGIDMTTDGGATWTAIVVTGAYTRVTLSQAAVTNPSVGFRIQTLGDSIAVDWVQNETGTFPTSVFSGARARDQLSFPFTTPPMAMTAYAKFVDLGTSAVVGGRVMEISNGGVNPRFLVFNPGPYTTFHNNGAATVQGVGPGLPAFGATTELRGVLYPDGSAQLGQSANGAAEGVGAQSGADAFAAAWSAQTLWVNTNSAGVAAGFAAFRRLLIAAGVRSLAELRSL